MSSVVTALVIAALLAYDARPERLVIVIPPTIVPEPTPVPFRPVGPDRSLPAVYPKPLEVPLPPRTATAVSLRVGPADGYVVVGTLQAGAPVQVVGRDESAEWVAVRFPPNATLKAWLPSADVLGLVDLEDLPVEPVRPLP